MLSFLPYVLFHFLEKGSLPWHIWMLLSTIGKLFILVQLSVAKKEREKRQKLNREGESGWIALKQLHASTEVSNLNKAMGHHGFSLKSDQRENYGWTCVWYSMPSAPAEQLDNNLCSHCVFFQHNATVFHSTTETLEKQ